MADTIKIPFSWKMLRPNNKQYRQNSIELEPISQIIPVKVPLNAKYIDNFIEITQYQLNPNTGRAEPLPILTPEGMAFCLNTLTDVLEVEDLKNEVKEDSNESWDDTEPEKKEVAQVTENWDEDNNKDDKEETFQDEWD